MAKVVDGPNKPPKEKKKAGISEIRMEGAIKKAEVRCFVWGCLFRFVPDQQTFKQKLDKIVFSPPPPSSFSVSFASPFIVLD